MSKKYLLSIFTVGFCLIAVAQEDLKLKLDAIAKIGLEKGIPGIQILISNLYKIGIIELAFLIFIERSSLIKFSVLNFFEYPQSYQ